MVVAVGNKSKLYWLFKWFIYDCSVGTVLIIIGVIIGWLTAPLLYLLYKTYMEI
jgi:hypothetical protein